VKWIEEILLKKRGYFTEFHRQENISIKYLFKGAGSGKKGEVGRVDKHIAST
jgi:hypothetical protein